MSGEKTAGLMPLLNRRAPFVNVRTPEYFITEAAREKYERALARFEGRRMYSFALPSDFGAALFELRFRGLQATRAERVELPFYSPTNRVPVYFFEVTRLDAATRAREPTRTRAAGELPPDAYRAEISLADAPATLEPGELLTLFFRARNAGNAPWPSLGDERGGRRFLLRARWLDARGEPTSAARCRQRAHPVRPRARRVGAPPAHAPRAPRARRLPARSRHGSRRRRVIRRPRLAAPAPRRPRRVRRAGPALRGRPLLQAAAAWLY